MTALRLWTIKPLPMWERLLATGTLRGDGRYVEGRTFRPAYRWMMEQMSERIAGYGGGFPIWAWYHPRPDLRSSAHLKAGTPGVCIELSVTADRVLLSDFDAWHFVLNNNLLTHSEREWEERQGLATDEEKRSSWQHIFDVRDRPYEPWLGRLTHIQAVIEEIRLSDVLSARHFLAR